MAPSGETKGFQFLLMLAICSCTYITKGKLLIAKVATTATTLLSLRIPAWLSSHAENMHRPRTSYLSMFLFVLPSSCIYIYIYIYYYSQQKCMIVCMHACVCACVCVCVYMFVCTCVCAYTLCTYAL